MINLDHAYLVTGAMFLVFAVLTLGDREHPTRLRSALFWGLIAASMLFGTWLGDLGNGLLVLGLVVLAGVRKLGVGKPSTTTTEERQASAARRGNWLFVPALIVPLVAVGGTLAAKHTAFGAWLISDVQTTLISLGLGCVIALIVGVAWLSGSRKGKTRKAQLEQVASGEAGLVVGTHAVIQDDVDFARLGLAVVDEQHRFGVAQRLQLRQKMQGDLEPHLLMMSATPIPRTLAMTYFADLDVSTLDELPPGRTPVVTKVFSDARREQVVQRIRDEVAQGRQVYWVCPLVEESEHVDLRNATETHAQLCAALPEHGVGLLHGRMSASEKAAVMSLFTGGDLAVLVATTVIEVGVDVPNASLMVVEHAERFGLAQLHQLRGRVGRGAVASVCVLLYTPPLSDTGKARLKAMAETTDGFEIARRDLHIRGPGEFLGSRQSGEDLLRFADLNGDTGLLEQARQVAPGLLARHPQAAQAHVSRWLGGRSEFLKA